MLSRERPGRYRLVRMPDTARRRPGTGDAALAYAERLTRAADATSEPSCQDVHAELVRHFDSASVGALVGVIIHRRRTGEPVGQGPPGDPLV